MENSADSFEYILHLTKVLSTECRTTRKETEGIEQLLKRLAKLTHVSYEDLSKEPSTEVAKKYSELNKESEQDRLVRENFSLIYQIEQQEYMNKRIWGLIDQIDDLLGSIKKFVVEQKAHRLKNEKHFIESIFGKRVLNLRSNITELKQSREISRSRLDLLIDDLRHICQEVDWSKVPASRDGQKLLQSLSYAEDKYQIKLK